VLLKRNGSLQELIKIFTKIERHLCIIAKKLDSTYSGESLDDRKPFKWELEPVDLDGDFHWRKDFEPMIEYIDDIFNLTPDFYIANGKYTFNFEDSLRFEKNGQDAMLLHSEILKFFKDNGFAPQDVEETNGIIMIKTFIKPYEEKDND
jgi:hypothetical protein